MNPFIKRLAGELRLHKEKNLLRNLTIARSCKIDLSSNDYLCLRKHPEVLAGAEKAQKKFGTGTGSSPLLSGFLPCHDILIKVLIDWKSMSGGLLFNSGFVANQAILKHLPGPNDLVLTDKYAHHSMIQALLSSKTRFKSYRHLDTDQLEELLKKNENNHETIFVVTESVFSMDGDYPNLKQIALLKDKYHFIWILDEAHAVGCFGASGGGLAEANGVLDRVDIFIGTLGKALGSMGGYVLTMHRETVDYLINFAGELIYSTFLPPAQAGAALASIRLVQAMDEGRTYLRKLSISFRRKLAQAGWNSNEFDSQIVPIIIGDNIKTMVLRDKLNSEGIRVGAIRPPTVPPGTARLRISLHTEITTENIDNIIKILNSCRSH